MHYNAAGECDRMGSKYESFLFPLVSLLMGTFFSAVGKYTGSQDKRNEKILDITAIALVCFFNLMNVYSLWLMFKSSLPETEVSPNFSFRLTAVGLGTVFVIMGNIMPKATRNSTFGLRTSWSMKDDLSWQKCQRIGGIVTVISGILIFAAGIFLSDTVCLIAVCVLFFLWFTVSLAASYAVSR